MNLTFLYIQINCFALVVLALVFRNGYRQDRRYFSDQLLYLLSVSGVGLLLALDTVMWLIEGRPHFRVLSIVVMVIYNSLNPLVCLLWCLYVDFYICGSLLRLRHLLIPLLVPFLFNAVLSFWSAFKTLYFVIDDQNYYHRGPWVWVMLVICLLYILYLNLFLLKNRYRLSHKEFISLLLLTLLPTAGAIVQHFTKGGVLIWTSAALSLLILFIDIQNDQLRTDYLTGLFNRRYLDHYLQVKLKSRDDRLLAGLMIDLDAFKQINDVYGHECGDQALRAAADVFRKTFPRRNFIARYGGDEFVVVMEIRDPCELQDALERLQQNAQAFNRQSGQLYRLGFSVGCDCFSREQGVTAAEFLNRIDKLMYEDKKNGKSGTDRLY